MRRSSTVAVVLLAMALSSCSAPATTAAAGPTTPSPTLGPWDHPRTEFVVHYALPKKDGCRADLEAWPPPGTATCVGWQLHLIAKEGVHAGELGGKACDLNDCRSGNVIPDAVSGVSTGPGASRSVTMAVSADGRRVAYLSAVERRFVGVDLRKKLKRHLSPVLTPDEMTKTSILADGDTFTVWYGAKGLRTDFTTGRTTPRPEPKEEWGYDASPSGERDAGVNDEASRNGTLEFRDTATRRVTRRLVLPGLGGATDSSVMEWRGNDEILLKMESAEGGDHLGWFLVSATSGGLRRLPGLPAGDETVVGAPRPQ
ncbi:hypothetical protein FXF51_33260 [Nonomuraea sp. PA05]|uniref:hypothetical protein n=1 Tax=Nonomuraea sp. PA05 TaxID=2604466 RepID=UPI0011D891AB|nr:hypothetical protein [Nonomuraea sp. PA05]TYB59878.1 hypothetical protein FXF51_33260 [Nonomuraea sp. PA05]